MSFYRTLLAAVAAAAIASPVFADDTATTTTTQDTSGTTNSAMQSTDNAAAPASTTTTTTTSSSSTDQAPAATDAKVNLNKATAKDLMNVKGLNASKARAIVAYRKKHGDFKTTDELANVKGFKKMKPEMMKEITDQLSVE